MLQGLSSIFGKVPKESYELLGRNIEIRKTLEKIYRDYKAGIEINTKDFDLVFNEIFRYFFRPLELAIIGARPLTFILPTRKNISLFETFSNTFQAYDDFLKSLRDHFQLTFSIFEKEGYTTLLTDSIKEFRELVEKYGDLELYDFDRYKFVADYPYILTNRALKHISESFEAWERFGNDYFTFKNLMKRTYKKAVEEFINTAKTKEFGSYSEFANEFYNIAAKHFDELLRSEEYLKVQSSMNSNLMDHIYHFRRFAEEALENNPLNPFATVSQLDEAYKRITDLKRKISELEKKIEEISKDKVVQA